MTRPSPDEFETETEYNEANREWIDYSEYIYDTKKEEKIEESNSEFTTDGD